MAKLLMALAAMLAVWSVAVCAAASADADAKEGPSMSQVYNGKVYGIFEPLRVETSADQFDVVGGTFRIAISRKTGQIVSAAVLGREFVAPGMGFPSPYIGLLPEDEPGATPYGGADRPRYGHELAVEIHPRLWSGGLTASHRFDAAAADKVEVIRSEPDRAVIRATGRYGDTAVTWQVEYDVDADGFTKVTVTSSADRPVKLRWHCFNHALLAPENIDFLVPWTDMEMAEVLGFRYQDTRPVKDTKKDELVFGAKVNPFFHLGSRDCGIEFSKQGFGDRWAGYKDTPVRLENGETVEIDAVLTEGGERIGGADSRGFRRHFTQIYRRDRGFEVEEFDVRNTTIPLNPGDARSKSFWFQMTPPKKNRSDLNCIRAVWPGPHQIVMSRWAGQGQWAPPSDETVRVWAQMGVKLVIGGANYFSGDYSHPTHLDQTRHFLETAHSLGLKVIPYVTFSDYNMCAPGYQEHALDWMCSSGTEFRDETTLMCFGAEGWRDHFEKEIDALFALLPFDGLYIDHWENTRYCTNARHGCSGYYVRAVTEGYHDIARRARRVVAKHTGGNGIMMLNSGQGVFSGALSMFDLRLMGENFDPLRASEMVLESTYNDERQGLHALVYANYGMDASFRNFVMSFTYPHPFHRTPRSIAEWQDSMPGTQYDGYKPYWDAYRFFPVAGAEKINAFAATEMTAISTPGARVNAFVRDARVMFVIGIVNAQTYNPQSEEVARLAAGIRDAISAAGVSGGVAETVAEQLTPFVRPGAAAEQPRRRRRERGGEPPDVATAGTLRITNPAALGLDPSRRYRVTDLLAHRYIDVSDFREIPVTLHSLMPQVILIEPEEAGPRIAQFTGADGMKVSRTAEGFSCVFDAAAGSPISVYVDASSSSAVTTPTRGFTVTDVPGGFKDVRGYLPDDRKVDVRIH